LNKILGYKIYQTWSRQQAKKWQNVGGFLFFHQSVSSSLNIYLLSNSVFLWIFHYTSEAKIKNKFVSPYPDRPCQNRQTEIFLLEICRHFFLSRFAENSVFQIRFGVEKLPIINTNFVRPQLKIFLFPLTRPTILEVGR
jgi:hypothetical protein